MRQADADQLITARKSQGLFKSVAQIHHRAGLDVSAVRRLAEADALASLGLSRRQAVWEVMALSNVKTPLVDAASDTMDMFDGLPASLPVMPLREEVMADYSAAGLSLKPHPVSFARPVLTRSKIIPAIALQDEKKYPHGSRVKVAGLVLCRQRPGTASGVVFVTLEDESGSCNLILWASVYERNRRTARYATLLQADGVVQREGQVIHILAKRLYDRTELLSGLNQPSRDFH